MGVLNKNFKVDGHTKKVRKRNEIVHQKIMVAPFEKKMRDSYPRQFKPREKITRLNQVGMRSAKGGIWVEVVKKNIT